MTNINSTNNTFRLLRSRSEIQEKTDVTNDKKDYIHLYTFVFHNIQILKEELQAIMLFNLMVIVKHLVKFDEDLTLWTTSMSKDSAKISLIIP